MFNRAIAGQPLPKRVSTDHDPLFCFHRWLANLRVLAIEEVKSVPYAPVSHPFVERLIGRVLGEHVIVCAGSVLGGLHHEIRLRPLWADRVIAEQVERDKRYRPTLNSLLLRENRYLKCL
jgi:hypothetical protein